MTARAVRARAQALVAPWREAWPQALAAWGATTRMHAPHLHTTKVDEAGSFAWYSTTQVEVHVDLVDVVERGLDEHAVAVLAHEVGHHVLSPADRRTAVRIAARVRAGLVDQDRLVGLVANLWSDLLINDRLQRSGKADLAAVWRSLGPPSDPVMALVLRACELLWELPQHDLSGRSVPVDEGAAWLCARLVRAYARDPIGGAGGFASLLRVTLADQLADERLAPRLRLVVCGDTGQGVPYGVASDPTLGDPVLHPSLDPAVVGNAAPPPSQADASTPGTGATPGTGPGTGAQTSGILPADLHATLAALGGRTSLEEVAVAWYRERAAEHLVPFPHDEEPTSPEPLLGGLEPWSVGDDLADVDWTGTLTTSPLVVPGMTTMRRQVLDDAPATPRRTPLDLDLYLDSSGSMADPRRFSWVALAGAVLALSALRAGARVQATTWSGPSQVAGTDGFTRDSDAVLRAVVAYFGGGTAFPLALLRRTYLGDDTHRPTATGPTHIAVVSDDGARSMVPSPQSGLPADLASRVLAAAGGGGSLLLDVPPERLAALAPALPAGYDVYGVTGDEALVEFARLFARRTWGRPTTRRT